MVLIMEPLQSKCILLKIIIQIATHLTISEQNKTNPWKTLHFTTSFKLDMNQVPTLPLSEEQDIAKHKSQYSVVFWF